MENAAQIVASLVTLADGWNEILGATPSPAEETEAPKPRKRRNTNSGSKRSKS